MAKTTSKSNQNDQNSKPITREDVAVLLKDVLGYLEPQTIVTPKPPQDKNTFRNAEIDKLLNKYNIKMTVDDQPVKEVNVTKFKDNKQKVLDFLFPSRKVNQLMARMELSGGDHVFLWINGNVPTFKYKTGTYIIDNQLKYYIASAKSYCLDYHQSFVLPIKRHIDPASVKSAMQSYNLEIGEEDMINATNPKTLKAFMQAEVIEGVMRGQNLSDFFKKAGAAIIAILVVVIVHFLLFLNASGMLKNLKIF